MIEVIPAILTKSYEDLKDKIALVRGNAPVVQIDICDGNFVPSITWPFSEDGSLDARFQNILNDEEGLPFWEDIDFELDLMTIDGVSNLDIYLKLGPRRIIFHTKAMENLKEFQEFLEGMDMYIKEATEIGIAVSVGEKIEEIFPLLPLVDFVQVMGIERVGFQGEDFSPKALELIKTLREKDRDIPIAVDGGVNSKTAPKIVEAGATRLSVGSAIFKQNDIMKAIQEFENLG